MDFRKAIHYQCYGENSFGMKLHEEEIFDATLYGILVKTIRDYAASLGCSLSIDGPLVADLVCVNMEVFFCDQVRRNIAHKEGKIFACDLPSELDALLRNLLTGNLR